MGKRLWSELQPDILCMIHARLFAGDSTIFNMICRSWRSAGTWILPPPLIDSPVAHSPCLVTLRNNICEFYHPVYNATYQVDSPELSGARIRSSGYGWLLVSKGIKSLFFFNPFTKEKINLPDSRWDNSMSTINFSSPPTSPDCFVIGMHPSCPDTFTGFWTIKHGETAWKYHQPDNSSPKTFLVAAYCSPVFSDGKWYILGLTGNIAVFDVKEKNWNICGNAWPTRKLGLIRPRCVVVEKNGGLLAVFRTHEHYHVRILRFDLSKMVWEDVESLGNDKMLYVSNGAAFLETISVIATGMGNKIYFPIFDRGNMGVFYSLSTKKYHSFDGKYCNESAYGLLEALCSKTWIKPVYTTADVVDLKWC